MLLPGSPVMRVTLRWNGSRKTGMRYAGLGASGAVKDRKSTRLNSSHGYISYAVFCLKKKQTELLLISPPDRTRSRRDRADISHQHELSAGGTFARHCAPTCPAMHVVRCFTRDDHSR